MPIADNYTLERFVMDCRAHIAAAESAAECVDRTAPCMFALLEGDRRFLEPRHFQSREDSYARNAIYVDPEGTLSLYALVWRPGQWTPVHDHGTWGVVGVVEGVLNEKSFMRTDSGAPDALTGIELTRGGIIMLAPGAVTSFVPNPDHIHRTGNPDPEATVVSLHLYGNAMAGFHIYDEEAGTRRWLEVSYG